MRRWIAFENDDESGMPTEAFLVVMAETKADAMQTMADAITIQGIDLARAERARIYAVFIEAVRELAGDDPRAALVSSPERPMFIGFDESRERPAPAPRYRGR